MIYDRQATFTKICERLAEGESLRAICRSEGFPAMSAVMRWLDEDKTLQEQYARAKELGFDALAEKTLEIADDGTNDYVAANDPGNPGYRLNGEHVQRSKLRVDARKWLLSKLAPKKYGDRIDVGNADDKPFQIDEKQAASRLASILAAAQARKAGEDDGSDLV